MKSSMKSPPPVLRMSARKHEKQVHVRKSISPDTNMLSILPCIVVVILRRGWKLPSGEL